MSHHGMREDYEFEDYATKIYMKGKVVYGSYWEHVNVSEIKQDVYMRHYIDYSSLFNGILNVSNIFQDAWQYRDHHNLKILWYEDMMENLSKVIQDIADFTNCKVLTY